MWIGKYTVMYGRSRSPARRLPAPLLALLAWLHQVTWKICEPHVLELRPKSLQTCNLNNALGWEADVCYPRNPYCYPERIGPVLRQIHCVLQSLFDGASNPLGSFKMPQEASRGCQEAKKSSRWNPNYLRRPQLKD